MGHVRGIGARVWGCLAVAGALGFALAGCAAAPAAPDAPATGPVTLMAASQGKTVTFPALFFEAAGKDDPTGYLAALGCTDVAATGDGGYTATVPADAYEGLVEDARTLAESAIEALPGGADHPNVTAVDHDEQFATVTVTLSSAELLPEDAALPYIPGEAAVMYQQVAGLPVGCDVILVGSDGSELSSTMFPLAKAPAEGSAEA